jgi:serine/threonine protein phosphatase 1
MHQTKSFTQTPRRHSLVALAENTAGRDFVVGDIHGQYDSLMAALDAVGFDEASDRLISVGDLIDRGPESLKCLNLLYEPWFHAVLGNHEDFFVSAFLEKDASAMIALYQNGGQWTLDEDEGDLRVIAADVVANMPLAIEIPIDGKKVGIIHAACTSGQWGVFDRDADIWNRRIAKLPDEPDALPSEALVAGIDAIVVGHNVLKHPWMRGNTLNLDTGAAKGRDVTLWSLQEVIAALDLHQTANALETTFPCAPGRGMDFDRTFLDFDDDSLSGPRLF